MIAWFVRDIWLKYHSWYFKIHWKFHLNNFEISLVVFMPNITANHAITCTNLQADCLNLVPSVFHLKIGRGTFPAVTVIWASPRFGDPHFQNPSDMGFKNGEAQNVGMPAYHCDTAPRAVRCIRCRANYHFSPCSYPEGVIIIIIIIIWSDKRNCWNQLRGSYSPFEKRFESVSVTEA